MLDRPWPWLSARIAAVLDTPPTRILVPVEGGGFELRPIFVTRIQQALAPQS